LPRDPAKRKEKKRERERERNIKVFREKKVYLIFREPVMFGQTDM
jgi:hypothetical protein